MRDIGSGNIGATNVLRTGSKGLAAATLCSTASRAGRGIARPALWPGNAVPLAAAGALIGHLYPVWLRFQRRQGRRDFPRRPRSRCCRCGAGLRRRLAGPAADDPNLVACGHGGGRQRAGRRVHSQGRCALRRCCSVSRCWSSGSTAKTSFASERNRATHRTIEDLVDRLSLVRSPGIGPGHLPPAGRALRQRRGRARGRSGPRAPGRRQGPGAAQPRRAEREIAQVDKLGARYLRSGRASIRASWRSSRMRRRC